MLRAVLDSMTDSIAIKDLKGLYIFDNISHFRFLGAANTAFLLLARMFWVLVIFTIVGGLTGSAPIALGPLVQVETLGLKRYGSIAGLLTITFTLGAMVGPPIVGKLADATGSYTLSFEVCALVAFVGAVASFLCVAPARVQVGTLVQAK